MRDATISKYTTKNRIGAQEEKVIYEGYGVRHTVKVDKAEVSLDDLFSGGNYYSQQMKHQFDEWKKVNTDEEISYEEFQIAAVNTGAFEYESIKNKQENTEFWVSIAATVVIIGAGLIFPPAGIVLAVGYGTMEMTSAVRGKDLISKRELDTQERWIRGSLSILDIVPGAGAVKRFVGTTRSAK